MKKKIKLVLSDLHLGLGRVLNGGIINSELFFASLESVKPFLEEFLQNATFSQVHMTHIQGKKAVLRLSS